MALCKLDIHQVRNIQQTSINPSPYLNFIYGANGSGKSAVLEAIYLLGRARSYRTLSIKSVIHFQQTSLIIAGHILQANGSACQLGLQMDAKHYEIRINQQSVQNRSDLAYCLPLQLIHPKSYELLDAGPQLRREFLDWGGFNDDKNFLLVWRRFKKALQQRNTLLKTHNLVHVNVWDKEVAYYGTIVNNHRQQYLQKLIPIFKEILMGFFDVNDVQLKLISGWDTEKSLEQALADDLEKDARYGFTHSGPHRGDFQLQIAGRLAKDIVSRGQLKLLVISLKLAQVQLLINQQGNEACILIDDFDAELDRNNRQKLLFQLKLMKAQVFITGTELIEFGDLSHLDNYKMFHVEQGNLKSV